MSRPWPKYVREGRNVEVKDKKGFAWPATITEIRHSRDDGVLEAVKVSYTGYASKFDEWVKDAARLNKSRGEEQSAMARAQRGYGGDGGGSSGGGGGSLRTRYTAGSESARV